MSLATRERRLVPRSKNCFACGTEQELGLGLSFEAIEPGRVVAELVVPARFAGHPSLVHGGVLATVLDEAFGAAMLSIDPTRFIVTAELALRYVAPVSVGARIRCEAWITHHHRLLARGNGSISLENGTQAVTATCVLAARRS